MVDVAEVGLGVMLLGIGLAVALIVIAAIAPTGIGQIANASTGSAMVNADAVTKTLFKQLGLFFVIALVVAIIGSVIAIVRHTRK